MDTKPGMFFYEYKGERLASGDFWPIPLYEGMEVTINGCDDKFKVKNWSYHHGHSDKECGLKIILERLTSPRIKVTY